MENDEIFLKPQFCLFHVCVLCCFLSIPQRNDTKIYSGEISFVMNSKQLWDNISKQFFLTFEMIKSSFITQDIKFDNKLKLLLIFLVAAICLVPTMLMNDSMKFKMLKPKVQICSKLPSESEILIDNQIWQVFKTAEGEFKLLNAYFDSKTYEVKINCNGPVFNTSRMKVYCQFWFEKSESPVIVAVLDFQKLFPSNVTGAFDKTEGTITSRKMNFRYF